MNFDYPRTDSWVTLGWNFEPTISTDIILEKEDKTEDPFSETNLRITSWKYSAFNAILTMVLAKT